MKRKTKNVLIAGLFVLGGGIVLAELFGKKSTAPTIPAPEPVPGYTPPTTYTPPANTGYTPPPTTSTTTGGIAVGDIVKAKNTLSGYTGQGLTTQYEHGGTDGYGNIEAGQYVGQVLSIYSNYSAKVRNYSTPMKAYNYSWGTVDSISTYYDFWVPLSDIKK